MDGVVSGAVDMLHLLRSVRQSPYGPSHELVRSVRLCGDGGPWFRDRVLSEDFMCISLLEISVSLIKAFRPHSYLPVVLQSTDPFNICACRMDQKVFPWVLHRSNCSANKIKLK